MNKTISVSLIEGKSKKSGKTYNAIKLEIGDWNTLVFPRSRFELNYIKSIIDSKE